MRAISRRNGDPKRASRPFDAERDGFVMGEAASMVVIEELERARARGAKIYAELLGYGLSSDATHVSDPDPTGQSPARALAMAFADAGITPDEVGYINAHGTSTPVGDIAESRVIKIALGEEKAHRTPVSSTKGATGRALRGGDRGPVRLLLSKRDLDHSRLGDVADRSRGAVSVDVADLVRSDPGVGERHRQRPGRALTRRVGIRHMRRVGREAVAEQLGVDLGPTCTSPLELLDHDHRRRLPHDEAVALRVERAGGALRIAVPTRDRPHEIRRASCRDRVL